MYSGGWGHYMLYMAVQLKTMPATDSTFYQLRFSLCQYWATMQVHIIGHGVW